MRLSAAIVVVLAAITPGLAQPSHDGRWSVVVITEQGPCDVYRWEFYVSGGRVSPREMLLHQSQAALALVAL
jgi:hypothetical protein